MHLLSRSAARRASFLGTKELPKEWHRRGRKPSRGQQPVVLLFRARCRLDAPIRRRIRKMTDAGRSLRPATYADFGRQHRRRQRAG